MDPLIKVNLGTNDWLKSKFIGETLLLDFQKDLVLLLHTYKTFFSWDYNKMLGLDISLVGHPLPIKSRLKPYRQPTKKITYWKFFMIHRQMTMMKTYLQIWYSLFHAF